MSLKAFHIAFIAVSTLLFLFVAAYALLRMDGSGRWLWAMGSLMLAAVMLVYGRRFLERMRTLRT